MYSDAETRGGATTLVKVNEVNRRFIAAFVALVFAISCMVVGINMATKAEEPALASGSPIANLHPNAFSGGGFVTSKQLNVNENGLYDLTIESYATGATITEQIPTDIVLILDQSGSMKKNDMPLSYALAQTQRSDSNWRISDIETDTNDEGTGKQAYYVKVGDNYYRAYIKRGYMYEYKAPNSIYIKEILDNTPLSWFQGQDEVSQAINAQYYYLNNGQFFPTTFTVSGSLLRYDATITYNNGTYITHDDNPTYQNVLNIGSGRIAPPGTFYDGVNAAVKALFGYDIVLGNWKSWLESQANADAERANFLRSYTFAQVLGLDTGMYIQSPLYIRHVGYNQLCYKDYDGVEHTLIDATYCDASGNALGGEFVDGVSQNTDASQLSNNDVAYWDGDLYVATQTTTRLDALNDALKQFVDNVESQTNSDGTKPDHRIAVVGFSSLGTQYMNTELLTGTTFDIVDAPFNGTGAYALNNGANNHNGIQYENSGISDYYPNALLRVNDSTEKGKIDTAIDSITAYGGTEPKYGFNMAYNILKARSAEDLLYEKKDGSLGRRNQVIIFFTDGTPGNYNSDLQTDDNQYDYANQTVDAAKEIKRDNDLNNPNQDISTPIYSVGTFGQADADPLLYVKTISRTDSNHFTRGDNYYLEDRLNLLYSLEYDHTITDTGVTKTSRGYSVNSLNSVFSAKYRIWQNDPANSNYPPTASDTIADYMETVSSAYPSATQFVDASWYGTGTKSDSGNYINMVDRVRGTKDESNKYYYLATNQNALTRAFTDIFTSVSSQVSETSLDAAHSLLRDTITQHFDKTTGNNGTTIQFAMQAGHIGEDGVTPIWDGAPHSIPNNLNVRYDPEKWPSSNVLDVYGYDYSGNYIASGHPGEKLIVTITNLKPTGTGSYLESNVDANSGIYYKDGTNETEYASLPLPSISRHSYTLNVGSDNTAATFDYATKLVGSGGNLDDVIVVVPESVTEGGTTTTVEHRYPYADFITGNADGDFGNWGNGTVFFYENVPTDYTIHTGLKTSDTDYTYFVAYDDDQAGTQPRSMTPNQATTRDDFSFDDHVINITSEANKRTVTIKETVSGNYANDRDTFTPVVYIAPASGTLPSASEWPSGWQQVGSENKLTPTTPIRAIQGDGIDSVDITVPAGWKLFIEQTDGKEYVLGDITYEYESGSSGTYTSTGVVVSDNAEIVIDNVRNSITVEGTSDQTNSYTVLLIILAGVIVTAGGASGVYIYKKKDELIAE